jgi:hypothetical protein
MVLSFLYLRSGLYGYLGCLPEGIDDFLTGTLRPVIPLGKSGVGHRVWPRTHHIHHGPCRLHGKVSIPTVVVVRPLRFLERSKGTHPYLLTTTKVFDVAMFLQQVSRLHQDIGYGIEFVVPVFVVQHLIFSLFGCGLLFQVFLGPFEGGTEGVGRGQRRYLEGQRHIVNIQSAPKKNRHRTE